MKVLCAGDKRCWGRAAGRFQSSLREQVFRWSGNAM